MINEDETISNIQRYRQALTTLWEDLGLGAIPHKRNFALWLMDHEYEAIVKALKVTAIWLNKQDGDPDPKRVRAYMDSCLRNAKMLEMSPDERKEEISRIRSIVGQIGALKRWKNERAKAVEELVEVGRYSKPIAKAKSDVLPSLPRFASDIGLGLGVGVDFVVGHDQEAASQPSGANDKSLKPKTKTRTNGSPSSCKDCGAPLTKGENHLLVCPVLNPKPKPDPDDEVEVPRILTCTSCSEPYTCFAVHKQVCRGLGA